MPVLDFTIDQLLSTTRAVRKRLDLDRPVEREILEECIRLATQAPTGRNRQRWEYVFVTEPRQRALIADLYRKGLSSPTQSVPYDGVDRTEADTPARTRLMQSAVPLRQPSPGAGPAHPLRPRSTREQPLRRSPGQYMGLDLAVGLAVHAGRAFAWPGNGMDHTPSALRTRSRPDPVDPVRQRSADRAHSRRLHHRRRLQVRAPGRHRSGHPLERVVSGGTSGSHSAGVE